MKQDNRGLSLVELLIVIAIMAVLVGVGVWGVNAMTGRPAQQCGQKIIYSLERHRTTAAGKVDASYTLRVDAQNRIIMDEYVSNDGTGSTSSSVLGSGYVTVTYVCGGSTYNLKDDPLTLQFDRSSGSFKKQADGTYCTQIIAASGGRTVEVSLVPLTGKVFME